MFCFCPSVPALLLSHTHPTNFSHRACLTSSAHSYQHVHTSCPLRFTLVTSKLTLLHIVVQCGMMMSQTRPRCPLLHLPQRPAFHPVLCGRDGTWQGPAKLLSKGNWGSQARVGGCGGFGGCGVGMFTEASNWHNSTPKIQILCLRDFTLQWRWSMTAWMRNHSLTVNKSGGLSGILLHLVQLQNWFPELTFWLG